MGDRKTRPDGFCFLASRKREDPLVSRLVLKLSSLELPIFSSFLNGSEKIWILRLQHSFRLRKGSPSVVHPFNAESFVSSNQKDGPIVKITIGVGLGYGLG
jgi:hypothetical protein